MLSILKLYYLYIENFLKNLHFNGLYDASSNKSFLALLNHTKLLYIFFYINYILIILMYTVSIKIF